MPTNVAIDNDFLSHLVEITRWDAFDLIVSFFSAMDVIPEMHPLVYENETKINDNKMTEKLFDKKIIFLSNFEEILSNPLKKNYYAMHIRKIYAKFMGREIPCRNIFSEWRAQASLGEVHTVVFCAMVGYDCFLSDDNAVARDLGRIVADIMSCPIKVKNRETCIEEIKKLENRTMSNSDLKIILHKGINKK